MIYFMPRSFFTVYFLVSQLSLRKLEDEFATYNLNIHVKNCQKGLGAESLRSLTDHAVCLWHAHIDI